ncbi:MAG TPA: FliH/SctL family protein [Bryobacteraceae bacterium]|nr:FliH/SctL family protein [Bryobacteraceae bacterium]
MLSKVPPDATVEVRPVSWRYSHGVPAKGSLSGTGKHDEVSQLRAKLAEHEQQVRQAHDAGFRAGEIAGRQNLEAEVRTVIERLAAAIADIAATRAETIRRAEADMVRLSVEIARRILHRELTVDAAAVKGLISAALQKLQSQEVYRVRVHPDQEKAVRSCLDQLGRGQSVEVISDPVQLKGGAVFEVASGSLDASVETQLSEIERGLTDQLETRR